MYFPNEVIGFREPIYPLNVCGKSGPRFCTPPQMKVQTGIMEISKPWLSKETNTQSRNTSKCFVLKIAQLLQSRICLKHSWEGFDLSNQKALIYITARRQEKQETLCLAKVNCATDGTEEGVWISCLKAESLCVERKSDGCARCYPHQYEMMLKPKVCLVGRLQRW